MDGKAFGLQVVSVKVRFYSARIRLCKQVVI